MQRPSKSLMSPSFPRGPGEQSFCGSQSVAVALQQSFCGSPSAAVALQQSSCAIHSAPIGAASGYLSLRPEYASYAQALA